MKLGTKIMALGIGCIVIPILIILGITQIKGTSVNRLVSSEVEKMSDANLTNIAKGIYATCETRHEAVLEHTEAGLNVARDVLNSTGDVFFSGETVSWNAVNQYTKATSSVTLSKMMVGGTWLGQNADMNTKSPVVDAVRGIVGGTCTIFQRMNEAGDMLRVSTNVIKKDGTRAIGTFIPATNPDGTPNPVISTILRGQTFRGRAYVVDGWYITAYEPIYDVQKKVAGVLYVGFPQDAGNKIRQSIMKTVIGKMGYVYVLGGRGDDKGHYIISAGGKRDGDNIWNAKDSDGNLFIQSIVKKAVALGPGKTAVERYPWEKGDGTVGMKVAKIVYYAPWDWVIGAGAYEDDVNVAAIKTSESFRSMMYLISIFGVVLVFAGGLLSFFIVRTTTKPINSIIEGLGDSSGQVSAASGQVSSASQSLAEGAAEQASALEETSSSLEEMSSMTKQNADNAGQANSLMKEAGQAVVNANDSMLELTTSMEEISKASEETFKIIKTIDEIAFQTNLLALNAAVEAARAGEHGAGFAVVAEEVRNLAMRSADAAKNTSDMIEGTVNKVKKGSELLNRTSGAFSGVTENATKVGELVGEIAAASNEQAQGIDQINKAVTEMDKVTQSNAANAEESASASEEMNAQAEQMKMFVGDLAAMVGGSKGKVGSTQYGVSRKGGTTGRGIAGRIRKAIPAPAKAIPVPKREVRPDEIIPMDEGDFKDF